MPDSQRKNNTPPRGGNWTKLESPGDVRRLLRWLILQTKADKMETRKASAMAQMALYLLKTLEVSDFEERLARIERALHAVEVENNDAGNPTSTH